MTKHKTRMRSSVRPRVTPDGFEPGLISARAASDDLSARFTASSYDAETRTVEAVFSAGSRVARWGAFEELEISALAIDLSRVALGQVRLLDTHKQDSVDSILGIVESARIDGGLLVGRIRFADTEAGRRAEGMVARGELTGISVGYWVTTWTLASLDNEVEVWRAVKWALLEVSLVAVPADPQASIRATPVQSQRADEGPTCTENDDMRRNAANPTAEPPATTNPAAAPEATRAAPAPASAPALDLTAERTRAADIMTIGTRANMSNEDVRNAIASGLSADAFRARAFEALAAAADATRSSPGASVQVTQDETETRMRQFTDALTVRMGGASALRDAEGNVRSLDSGARSYLTYSFAEMASVVLGTRSMPRTSADREDVLRRAMQTTSDFPIIFESTINRVLASRYQVAAPTYREISVRRHFVDFRPHDQIRVGDFPMLQPVKESGEIKFGSFGESKETVAVAPYAVQFAISRRMLIDDNIGAIDQMLGSYGDSVARFEEQTFYAMKGLGGGNGPMLFEGKKPVFDTSRGNIAAVGSDVSADGLSAGRAVIRKQTNQSGALLNLKPSILLVGADQETNADKALAVITPVREDDVNPFGGKLRTVVAPISGDQWEIYAEPSVAPVFVWGMLDGYEAPRMRIENPFGVQGVGVSLEHDFGCGAIDFRGAYRSPNFAAK
jgi:HK97 family phage prohead protease